MSFINAMDAEPVKVLGENGSAELATTGDSRVNLFFKLVRDLPEADFKALVDECFDDKTVAPGEMAADLIVLAFQTRDCRGGKGERRLFVRLFKEIAARFPATAATLVPLIPSFGYWKDIVTIIEECEGPAAEAAVALAAAQLGHDLDQLAAAKPESVSLLGKWAPREGGAHTATAKRLARAVFPEPHTRPREAYRKGLAALNRHLGTVEVLMCGAAWADIDPTAVPSLALMRGRKALLNEKAKGPAPTAAQAATGNRHPDDEDRVACRKRLMECLLDQGHKKLKGQQLFPHEIVQKVMHSRYGYGARAATSNLELELYHAQWVSLREATKRQLEEAHAEAEAKAAEVAAASGGGGGSMRDGPEDFGEASAPSPAPAARAGVDLGKLVALVDVSGSMGGTPMEVAIALGIMVSELAAPAFAHRVITFHETPTWCAFEPGAKVAEKVRHAQAAPWGGSTDFAKAMELILDVAVKARLAPDEIPNLIVFSDMQFDQAQRGGGSVWETHHERLARRFAECGVKVCGKPWPVPEMTYWNLRASTSRGGFPAGAGATGVRLLSGFSPSLMKLLLSGALGEEEEGDEVDEEDKEGGEATSSGGAARPKKKANPLDVLRKALDAAAYDPVRVCLSASQEGALAAYAFEPPSVVAAKEAEA